MADIDDVILALGQNLTSYPCIDHRGLNSDRHRNTNIIREVCACNMVDIDDIIHAL